MHYDPSPLPLESPLLATHASSRIRHGFFTRQGGVSQGLYRGLNVGLGSKDEQAAIAENRRRVAGWFGLALGRLVTVHQTHSTDVATVCAPFDAERPMADAMVTATPGLILGVLSADCGPVLFADAQAGVVGAAHAGWKGALHGVLENTVAAMVALGAARERIAACLGPSISRDNYEVGPEFIERFVAVDPAYERYFIPSPHPGRALFDLRRLTLDRLKRTGLTIQSLDLCTYPDEDRFFSYRRATHRSEDDYGRQISAIAILEK